MSVEDSAYCCANRRLPRPLSLEKKTFSREGNSCRNQGFCLTFPEKKTRQSYVGGPIIVHGEEGLMERRPDSLLLFSGDFLEIGDIPRDFQLISKSKSPAVVEEQQRFRLFSGG
ncbi:hypothetical protein AAC387_Pa11g0626 [Persea americana]